MKNETTTTHQIDEANSVEITRDEQGNLEWVTIRQYNEFDGKAHRVTLHGSEVEQILHLLSSNSPKGLQAQKQQNLYEVVYSDGVTVVDHFIAANLTEAKKIARERSQKVNYQTAYYKVRRCYNGGVRGSDPTNHWH